MSDSSTEALFASEEALDSFIQAFFEHSLPKTHWTHAAHVALASYLLYDQDVSTALPKVREAIKSYNEAVGTRNTADSGYHETLTVFWLKIVSGELQEIRAASRLDAVCRVVAVYGERRGLHAEYYSTDIVRDPIARRQWVEPDLGSL